LVEALDEIAEGAHRIASIVRDLKVFSRVEVSPQVRATDVARAIELALRMTGAVVRSRARIITSIEPVGAVAAVEARLVQVLVNSDECREASPPARPMTITIGVAPCGDSVEIAITDTRTGDAQVAAGCSSRSSRQADERPGLASRLPRLVTDMVSRSRWPRPGKGPATVCSSRRGTTPQVARQVRPLAEPAASSRSMTSRWCCAPARMLRDPDLVTADDASPRRCLFEGREHLTSPRR
jgi:hypothetical protein